LTESVIDAATLLPLELDCSILALYGTNGLSEEHQSVIRNLMQLKEVILAMDGDEAGRPAGEQIARAIKKIRSSVKVSRLEIAEGEDAIIFGTVISKEDNKPIPNAAISIVNSDIGAITSGQGMFSIPITPGRYHLICNAVGYDDLHIRKAIVEKGKSLEITVKLGTTKIYQK